MTRAAPSRQMSDVLAHPEFRVVADQLFRWSERLLGIDGAAMYLAEGDSLVCRFSSEFEERQVGPVRLLTVDDTGPISHAFRTGSPRLWMWGDSDEPVMEVLGWRSSINMPLSLENRTIGVYVAGWRAPHRVSDEAVTVLEGAASMAAAALHRARLLAEVRREENRLRRLLDSLPLPAVVVDHANLAIEWTNVEARRLLGDVEGRRAARVVADAHVTSLSGRPLDEEDLPDLLLGRSPSRKVRLLDTRGREHVVLPRIASLGEDSAVVILVDVTTETHLDAHRARFVRMVSHHLRTPLTPLLGYLDLFATDSDGVPSPLQEAIREASVDLVGQVERLERIAALRPAQPEELELVPVGSLLANAMSALSPESDQEPVVEGDLSASVWCVPEHAAQAMAEVLLNAMVHGEPPIRVDVEPSVTTTLVAVRDEGPGISPEWAAAVFSPFLSAESEYLAPPEGRLGVGLTLARGLMEANRGSLDWEDDAFVLRLRSGPDHPTDP